MMTAFEFFSPFHRAITFPAMAILYLVCPANADETVVRYTPIFQIPDCINFYDSARVSGDGETILMPKGRLYCIDDDVERRIEENNIFREISERVPNGFEVRELFLSSHYIESLQTSEFLCNLPGMREAYVEMSIQENFVDRPHANRAIVNSLLGCSAKFRLNILGCDPFKPDDVRIYSACWRSEINQGSAEPLPRSHHLKFLGMVTENVQTGELRSVIALGSGNFSRESLSVNIEDWHLFDEELADGDRPWWQCLVNLTRDLATTNADEAKRRLDSCGEQNPQELVDGGEYKLMLMPFDREDYFQEVERLVAEAVRVEIVAQFFESDHLKELARNNPDTNFLIYVDDAYGVAHERRITRNFISPESADIFFDFVENNSNVQVRFLQTNHDFQENGMTNTVHARSILFFENETVFASMGGSSHFRDGAIRRNTENQLFFYGAAAALHAEFFAEIEQRSISRAEIGTPR